MRTSAPEVFTLARKFGSPFRGRHSCAGLSGNDSAAKATEAAGRISAWFSRHSLSNLDAQKKQVDEWYRTTFRTQTELNALRELSRLAGGRRRGE